MLRVVHELEVDVRVVDRRVAAERVVRDVERVVRARGDRQPASYAALNTVVETWQTPPPRPVWSSPLMITGASRKPFAAVRSPVVRLNENVAPGRDQLAVDQVRDELDVVDPVRDAAVDRLVACRRRR